MVDQDWQNALDRMAEQDDEDRARDEEFYAMMEINGD